MASVLSAISTQQPLMSQFIHHRLLMTKRLCLGVVVLAKGRVIFLSKQQSQNNRPTPPQPPPQEGWLLATCRRTVSPCLPYTSAFLSFSPLSLSLFTFTVIILAHPSVPLSICVSVCVCQCLSGFLLIVMIVLRKTNRLRQ